MAVGAGAPDPSVASDAAKEKYESDFAENERELSSFLCHLRCDRSVTEKSCIEVANFVKSFCLKSGYQLRKYPDLSPEELPATRASSSWTTYKLRKVFQSITVEPRTIYLGVTQAGVQQSFQYVPIVEQLSALIQHDELKHLFLQERISEAAEPGVYGDLSTGENHRHKTGISLIIYYDDFNIVNPVGNKVKRNKLGAFYFALGKTPFRSRKRHIFLLALFRTSYLKGCHGPLIIKTIVDDIKRLEEDGIRVQTGSTSAVVRGSLSVFSADNLAIHTIGGFLESFSKVNKVSRFCNCSSSNIQSNLRVTSCRLQTVAEYEARISELRASNFNRQLCLKYGIKAECQLNDLRHFHVIECTPPDIAHDLYEGVVPLVIREVLGELVKSKIISLAEINNNINHFPYSGDDAFNKPQPVTISGGKIRCTQTAKEAFNLVRLLPLLIGYKVPRGFPVWTIFLSFLAIVRIFAAPRFRAQDLDDIQAEIESWLAAFVQHFRGVRVTPKLHYILHYANQIRKHGALSAITTLRFESKHQALKQLVSTSKNRKNVCKSIAKKHQQWLAEKMRCADFFSWKTSFLPSHTLELADGDTEAVEVSMKAVIKGTTYRSGDVVVAAKGDGLQFAVIASVQRSSEEFQFSCRRLHVVEFDEHGGAFYVTNTEEQVIIKHKELVDYHPLQRYGGRYVVEHHTLTKRGADKPGCWN